MSNNKTRWLYYIASSVFALIAFALSPWDISGWSVLYLMIGLHLLITYGRYTERYYIETGVRPQVEKKNAETSDNGV